MGRKRKLFTITLDLWGFTKVIQQDFLSRHIEIPMISRRGISRFLFELDHADLKRKTATYRVKDQ